MIYIVGCHHGIQPQASMLTACDPSDQNRQRGHFKDMLRQIFKEDGIQFVFEEAGDVEETITQHLAAQFNLPWKDINTSNADKDRLGIPRYYVQEPYTNEQKNRWNQLREKFMLGRINEYRSCAQNLLIICGFDHVDSLAASLGNDGIRIRRVDYRTLEWYQEGVFDT